MKKVTNFQKHLGLDSGIYKSLSLSYKFALPDSVQKIQDFQKRFSTPTSLSDSRNALWDYLTNFRRSLESDHAIFNVRRRVRNNPEMQYSFITDFELLNIGSSEQLMETLVFDGFDDEIESKEEILQANLVPYLREMGLDSLWEGANHALHDGTNPDRLRHCMISLRTLLECLIDSKLAPNSELKDSPMFSKEFRNFRAGKTNLESVLVKRGKRIEYFMSKIQFAFLEKFTEDDVRYVCSCYKYLCDVHKPNIEMAENEVRVLKVKTGIIIWLLVYIYDVISPSISNNHRV
jgi:hypothetical protein